MDLTPTVEFPGSCASPSASPQALLQSSFRSRVSPGSSSPTDASVAQLVYALHAYEALLQVLFAKGGELAMAAIAAQSGENVSPISGHQVLAAISNAQLLVAGALGHMADGHRQLEVLGRKLGIDVSGFGDVLKPQAESRSGPAVGLAAA